MVSWIFSRPCVLCSRRTGTSLCEACASEGGLSTETPRGLPVRTLGHYQSKLGPLLRALKYSQETRLATPLGEALGLSIPSHWRGARWVPVPLHPERLVERGYNQSALLARAGARACGSRVDFDSLSRSKSTRAQARLDKAARQQNAERAFVARPPRSTGQVRVLIVDDVVTTGATLDACAVAMTQAGFLVLGAAAVAWADRAPLPSPFAPDSLLIA